MPSRDQYVPKHRGAPVEPALKKGLRKSLLFSGVAVVATGIAVSSGIAVQDGSAKHTASTSLSSAESQQDSAARWTGAGLTDRTLSVSRSDRRTALDEVNQQALEQRSGGQVTRVEDLTRQDPRRVARAMLPQFGFADSEFGCLDALYHSESGWNPRADNPISSAFGIPQALTGGTHVLPDDYMTNPVSQIRWGLGYIKSTYGTPCSAWGFKQSHRWY